MLLGSHVDARPTQCVCPQQAPLECPPPRECPAPPARPGECPPPRECPALPKLQVTAPSVAACQLTMPSQGLCPVKNPTSEPFKGQDLQDKLIYEKYFKTPTPHCYGVFVEVGAHQGIELSNCVWFEQVLGWRGFCIEPNPTLFPQLSKNRPLCVNINAGASNETGKMLSFINANWHGGFEATGDIPRMRDQATAVTPSWEAAHARVPTVTVADVLRAAGVAAVDLLSVDVEGHELQVLQGVDFAAARVRLVLVEAHPHFPEMNAAVDALLVARGFEFVPSHLKIDRLYVNKLFKR
eukprot:TRINITY_DN4236_c0_g1_i1.p1 TRINITY_DN4236_c0_g1~~TRINITY_DN4236_c0_g1_i1.p1  ORF type:complete len:296 (-),score=92.30 TRINITY_DN4236_c0_g1_i1:89-976(-)